MKLTKGMRKKKKQNSHSKKKKKEKLILKWRGGRTAESQREIRQNMFYVLIVVARAFLHCRFYRQLCCAFFFSVKESHRWEIMMLKMMHERKIEIFYCNRNREVSILSIQPGHHLLLITILFITNGQNVDIICKRR